MKIQSAKKMCSICWRHPSCWRRCGNMKMPTSLYFIIEDWPRLVCLTSRTVSNKRTLQHTSNYHKDQNLLSQYHHYFFALITWMSTATETKARSALEETNESGEFKRKDSTFREIISEDHPVFKPEAGRYHLYISLAWWVSNSASQYARKSVFN